jgi:mono/diheme cytochrome c family protein
MKIRWSFGASLAVMVLAGSLAVIGQEGAATKDVTYKTPVPKVTSPAKPNTAPGEKTAVHRGEVWFYQRCAICHMDRIHKDITYKQIIGPQLTGILKDPSREAAVREVINKGTLRMPGFQYGLSPKEIDEVIAFLKTY